MIRDILFRGMQPRLLDRQLPEGAAKLARDCWLSGFRPRPIPDIANYQDGGVDIVFPATTETIYPYDTKGDGTIRWLYWDEDVDVVRAPVRDDAANRVLWMGDGSPKQTNSTILQAGAGITSNPQDGGAIASRALGVAPPGSAPTVTAGTLSTPDTSEAKITDAWVYTFVTDLGEEGPPSPASGFVERGFSTAGAIQPVTLSELSTGPSGNNFYTRKRIYRTLVGSQGSGFHFLTDIPITQTSYTDNTLPANLGEELPSTNWDPPENDLKGLLLLPNGVCAAFKGRELHFSEPYQPHAWPGDYVQVIEEEIVGIGNYGTTVVIGTTGSPYLSSGSDPAVATPAKMELDQACVSKRSFARASEQGIVYASPDGLVLVGPGGARLVTREVLDRQAWQTYIAGNDIRAVYHDEAFLAFNVKTAGTGFAFSREFEGLVETTDNVIAVHRDLDRDTIWVVDRDDRKMREWRSHNSTGGRSYRWSGRLHTGPLRTYSAVQVIAESYGTGIPVTITGDSVSKTITLTSSAPARFSMPLATEWSYLIRTDREVREVRIGSMQDML